MSNRTSYARDLSSGTEYCGNCAKSTLEGDLNCSCKKAGRMRIVDSSTPRRCTGYDRKKYWDEDDYWKALKYLYVSSAICEVLGLPLDHPFNLSVGAIKNYTLEHEELNGLWYEYEAIGWALASCIRTPDFKNVDENGYVEVINNYDVAFLLYNHYADYIINLVQEGKLDKALEVYIGLLKEGYIIYNQPSEFKQIFETDKIKKIGEI